MYVQAAEHFPGIVLLPDSNSIRFDTNTFYDELPEMMANWDDLSYFDISPPILWSTIAFWPWI